jgi:hypothetical protein
LTQKLIANLFDKGRSTITEHLKNIFIEGELEESAVCRDFRHTGADGEFSIKGFVIDKPRMENGSFLNEDYFHLLLINYWHKSSKMTKSNRDLSFNVFS